MSQQPKPYDRRKHGDKLYGRRWKQLKSRWLTGKFCKECDRKGIIRAATEVDHIQPHRGVTGLFWDQSNWQPLCQHCHNSKSAKERNPSAKGQSVEPGKRIGVVGLITSHSGEMP